LTGPARLVLADEPTGQLDHDSGAAVIDALLDFAERQDVGLLVATHDVTVAERVTSGWVMAGGGLSMVEVGACRSGRVPAGGSASLAACPSPRAASQFPSRCSPPSACSSAPRRRP